MAAVSDKVELYVAAESTYGADPDSDGSDYVAAQIKGQPYYSDDSVLEDSDYATGRNVDTIAHVVQQGGSIPIEMELTGLSAFADDGTAPPTADALDLILSSVFGASASLSGEGIASGANDTTNVLADTNYLAVEDLVLINLESGYSEFRPIATIAAAGPPAQYTLSPALSGTPDATKDVMGCRYWVPSDTAGSSLSAYLRVDGTGWRLSGCRPTSLKIMMEAGKKAMLSTQLKADSITRESKGSLPALTKFSNPPIVGRLGSLHFGSTQYAVKSCEIDFQVKAVDVGSIAGAQGRGTIFVVSKRPKITITPAFATAWEDDFAAGTERSVLVQFGTGARSSGRVSTVGFFAQSAQIRKHSIQDDGGYLRKSIEMQVTDGGIRTGTTAYRHWTLARS